MATIVQLRLQAQAELVTNKLLEVWCAHGHGCPSGPRGSALVCVCVYLCTCVRACVCACVRVHECCVHVC